MIQLLRINGEANPVLESGQLGYDTYRHAIKIGDGSTDFNSLPATAADPSIYKTDGINYGDSSGDIYMYGYQGNQILQSIAAGNIFYGDLEGTADNALLFDDMTSDDVYHINNKPTKADVGLDKVQNQYNYGHVEVNSGQLGAGYLTLNNCRIICQRYSINVTPSQFGAAGNIYMAQINTNLMYYWAFKTVPNVVMGTYIHVDGLIDVRPTKWDKSKITQLQVFSYNLSINGEVPIVVFAMG